MIISSASFLSFTSPIASPSASPVNCWTWFSPSKYQLTPLSPYRYQAFLWSFAGGYIWWDSWGLTRTCTYRLSLNHLICTFLLIHHFLGHVVVDVLALLLVSMDYYQFRDIIGLEIVDPVYGFEGRRNSWQLHHRSFIRLAIYAHF